MSKYPYYLGKTEQDGTRDKYFCKVISPSAYLEIIIGNTIGINFYTPLKKFNTDTTFKEKNSEKEWVIARPYFVIPKSEFDFHLDLCVKKIKSQGSEISDKSTVEKTVNELVSLTIDSIKNIKKQILQNEKMDY